MLAYAEILLLLAEGTGIRPTADQLRVGYNTVRRWRDRFLAAGCPGIEHDAPGRGMKPVITEERKAEIVRMTTQEKPANATHWSLSRMAQATGLSTFAVWKQPDLLAGKAKVGEHLGLVDGHEPFHGLCLHDHGIVH